MSNPFFSIIIPAYNSADHLEDCIDSLRAQSCGDFEVIIVDDGSTDATLDLAERLSCLDNRVLTMSIPHAGTSAARNAGIAQARGTYVILLDADDMLVDDALERVRDRAQSCDALPDMLWFGFVYQREDGPRHDGSKCRDACYANASAAVVRWIRDDTLPVSACNKAYRVGFLREHGLAFREGVEFGEDRLFNIDVLAQCGLIITMPDSLYVYHIREGSASHSHVVGLLEKMLAIHRDRVSCFEPLCQGVMSSGEYSDFVAFDYVKSVKQAWLYLSERWAAMSASQRTAELKPFLEVDASVRPRNGHTGWKRRVAQGAWLGALGLASRARSIGLLELMMRVTRAARRV